MNNMTTSEFKEKYPQYKNLEGDSLWDKMEETLLKLQRSKPKKYQLRWLFYRRKRNLSFGRNNYTANEICDKCRKGVSNWLSFIDFADDKKFTSFCPHCNKDLKRVPNTNLNHMIWKAGQKIKSLFWGLLDYTHLVRSSHEGRYDMFGDEHYFVKSDQYDSKWNHVKRNFRPRKWWEYVIIEKR